MSGSGKYEYRESEHEAMIGKEWKKINEQAKPHKELECQQKTKLL